MKRKNLFLNTLVMTLAWAGNACAAGREDHSGILVWGFLGFCALIVAAQLVPAVLVLFGVAKGIAPGGSLEKEGGK